MNAVVELRQYTLHPGQRDVLIDLFDRELVESQEAEGATILGQFRDLDQPDRFVWIRGFADLPRRADALTRFYSGPTWKANSGPANATMVDVDNVLLLRPVSADSGFPAPSAARPPAGTPAPSSTIVATICARDRPFDEEFADFFAREVRPALIDAGAAPLALLQTEYAENNFPALPVRTGEHVFVWFTRWPDPDHPGGPVPTSIVERLTGPPQQLRLAPTGRSLLR